MLENRNGRASPGLTGSGRGFTLVEIVAVTAITGLLATVALPVVARSLAWWQVQSAAWQLAAKIRAVQLAAMNGEDKTLKILFVEGENLYRLRKQAVIIEEIRLPEGVTLKLNLNTGIELAFNLDGVPTNSGKIILQDRFGRKYYLTITPVTGRVKAGDTG